MFSLEENLDHLSKQSGETEDREQRLKALRFEVDRMRQNEQQMKNTLADKDSCLEKANEMHFAMDNTIKKLRADISQMNMVIERVNKTNSAMDADATRKVEQAEKEKSALEAAFKQVATHIKMLKFSPNCHFFRQKSATFRT